MLSRPFQGNDLRIEIVLNIAMKFSNVHEEHFDAINSTLLLFTLNTIETHHV